MNNVSFAPEAANVITFPVKPSFDPIEIDLGRALAGYDRRRAIVGLAVVLPG